MSAGNWKEMFSAATQGDLNLLEYHVEQGVDVNYVHPEFLGTALVSSILAKKEETALYLLDNGADPDLFSDLEELFPLQAARQAGLTSVEAKLLAMGVEDVGAEDAGSEDVSQVLEAGTGAAPTVAISGWFARLLKRFGRA